MQTFEEWLVENHPEMIDEGMMNWLKEKGRKVALPLALAAGIGGGGGMAPSSADAGIRQVTPSRSSTSDIRQVRVSQASSLRSLFRQVQGGLWVPAKGNGVLVKNVTSVDDDELKGDVNDFTVYDQDDISGAVPVERATGRGMSWEEAAKDALRLAAHQGIGAKVDATTVVKNDELEKDSVVVSGSAVIRSFRILPESSQRPDQDGIWEVSVAASVSKPSGASSGSEGHYKVADDGGVRTYKHTIATGR